MKQCGRCGLKVNDTDLSCSRCGSTNLRNIRQQSFNGTDNNLENNKQVNIIPVQNNQIASSQVINNQLNNAQNQMQNSNINNQTQSNVINNKNTQKISKKEQKRKEMAMMKAMQEAVKSGQVFNPQKFEFEWQQANINRQNKVNDNNDIPIISWIVTFIILSLPMINIAYSLWNIKNDTNKKFFTAFSLYYIVIVIVSVIIKFILT